jgi:hypothetical protein
MINTTGEWHRSDPSDVITALPLPFVALLGLLTSAVARAGWYTPPRIPQGRWEYSLKCAPCHGPESQGGGAPALNDQIPSFSLSLAAPRGNTASYMIATTPEGSVHDYRLMVSSIPSARSRHAARENDPEVAISEIDRSNPGLSGQ